MKLRTPLWLVAAYVLGLALGVGSVQALESLQRDADVDAVQAGEARVLPAGAQRAEAG